MQLAMKKTPWAWACGVPFYYFVVFIVLGFSRIIVFDNSSPIDAGDQDVNRARIVSNSVVFRTQS